jgi:hypothetical protein
VFFSLSHERVWDHLHEWALINKVGRGPRAVVIRFSVWKKSTLDPQLSQKSDFHP